MCSNAYVSLGKTRREDLLIKGYTSLKMLINIAKLFPKKLRQLNFQE